MLRSTGEVVTCPCRSAVQRTNKKRGDEANVKMPCRQGVYETNNREQSEQVNVEREETCALNYADMANVRVGASGK
jgi:hypothetical protein